MGTGGPRIRIALRVGEREVSLISSGVYVGIDYSAIEPTDSKAKVFCFFPSITTNGLLDPDTALSYAKRP